MEKEKEAIREFNFLGVIRAERGPKKIVRKYYIVVPREVIRAGIMKPGDTVQVKVRKIENII